MPEIAEWLPETVAPEIRSDPSLAKYKSIEEFHKGFKSLESSINAKGVILPGEKATDEDWDKFYTQLGMPEKPEGYTLTELKELHPEIKVTPEGKGWFQGLARKARLTPQQADLINVGYMTALTEKFKARDAEITTRRGAAQKELMTQWGDKYEVNLKSVSRFVEKVGGPDMVTALGDLGGNPKVLAFLHNISRHFSEDGVPLKGNSMDGAGSEKQVAEKKIKEIMGDPKSAYNDGDHPGHQEALDEIEKLARIAYAP